MSLRLQNKRKDRHGTGVPCLFGSCSSGNEDHAPSGRKRKMIMVSATISSTPLLLDGAKLEIFAWFTTPGVPLFSCRGSVPPVAARPSRAAQRGRALGMRSCAKRVVLDDQLLGFTLVEFDVTFISWFLRHYFLLADWYPQLSADSGKPSTPLRLCSCADFDMAKKFIRLEPPFYCATTFVLEYLN